MTEFHRCVARQFCLNARIQGSDVRGTYLLKRIVDFIEQRGTIYLLSWLRAHFFLSSPLKLVGLLPLHLLNWWLCLQVYSRLVEVYQQVRTLVTDYFICELTHLRLFAIRSGFPLDGHRDLVLIQLCRDNSQWFVVCKTPDFRQTVKWVFNLFAGLYFVLLRSDCLLYCWRSLARHSLLFRLWLC